MSTRPVIGRNLCSCRITSVAIEKNPILYPHTRCHIGIVLSSRLDGGRNGANAPLLRFLTFINICLPVKVVRTKSGQRHRSDSAQNTVPVDAAISLQANPAPGLS